MDYEGLYAAYVDEGLSAAAIAGRLGCCKATVLKRLRSLGIPLRPAGVKRTSLTKRLLVRLYTDKGFSARMIARTVGCGSTTVFRHLHKHGIVTRTLSEANKRYVRASFCGTVSHKAYLLGFAIGDLRVRTAGRNSDTVKVDCCSTKEAQIDLIRTLFEPYGHVWVSRVYKRGNRQVEAFLDGSFSFLLSARTDIFFFLDRHKEAFFPFLAGFSDAEGCFGITNGRAYFSLGNYDKGLLLYIREQLLKRAIMVPSLYTDKKLYISSHGYRRNNYYHHLRICRKDALKRFIEALEPFVRHRDKKVSMGLAAQNIKERTR